MRATLNRRQKWLNMKGRIIMNKKIKDAIINLCLRESSYDVSQYDETLDILGDFDWSKLNIKPSDFSEVYVFKASGDYFMAHNFENERMFSGKKAIKLYEDVGCFTSEVFCAANLYEIWLREDMKLEAVNCYRMDVDGSGGEYTVEYRYPVWFFSGEFDTERLLENLIADYGTECGKD